MYFHFNVINFKEVLLKYIWCVQDLKLLLRFVPKIKKKINDLIKLNKI